MADDFVTGKLSVDGRQLRVLYKNRNGKDVAPAASRSVMSSGVTALAEDQKDGTEVEVLLKPDQMPKLIRLVGEQTTEPAPIAAAHSKYGRGKGRGDRRGGGKHPSAQKSSPQHSGGQSSGPASKSKSNPGRSGGRRAYSPADCFHNPYNFVPVREGTAANGDLKHGAPLGHHRLFDDRYTGWVEISLTTATPLLLPDAADVRLHGDRRDHKKFPIRMGLDNRPYLHPGSLKGALSVAYESITNSRLRVFEAHGGRLGKRMRTQEGLKLVPARVQGTQVALMTGDASIGSDGKPIGTLYAAWLPRYANRPNSSPPITYSDGTLPLHRDEVECWVELFQHWTWRFDKRAKTKKHCLDFKFWRVRVIARRGTPLGPKPVPTTDPGKNRGQNYHQPLGRIEKIRQGWVCITNENIDNKHDERVFFIDSSATNFFTPLEDVSSTWKDLIEDYQREHSDEIKKGKQRPPAANAGGWSRHIGDGSQRVLHTEEKRLRDGDLCYARVKADGTGWKIAALFPVNISRELFPNAPAELLDGTLKPAMTINELSPADRVFGWVSPDADKTRTKDPKSPIAFRGQLRVGHVECRRDDAIESLNGDDGIPLAILSTPKPSQSTFYLADQNGDPVRRKNDGYQKVAGQQLRGRKVYPHHRNFSEQGGEFRRQGDVRDDQNRSMLQWVKKDTEFVCKIHVTNLSKAELGALLWLLRLDQIYPEKEHFLRLGGGKPLGFGSVRVAISGSDLRTGTDWQTYYRSLDETPPPNQDALVDGAIDAYQEEIKTCYGDGKPFDEVDFIQAYLATALGPTTDPIHYPRMNRTPDAQGKNFKWFEEAERRDGRPLPKFTSEDQPPELPYYDAT